MSTGCVRYWDGAMVLKGIQTVADASRRSPSGSRASTLEPRRTPTRRCAFADFTRGTGQAGDRRPGDDHLRRWRSTRERHRQGDSAGCRCGLDGPPVLLRAGVQPASGASTISSHSCVTGWSGRWPSPAHAPSPRSIGTSCRASVEGPYARAARGSRLIRGQAGTAIERALIDASINEYVDVPAGVLTLAVVTTWSRPPSTRIRI